MQREKKILIVGGGFGGLSAAVTFALANARDQKSGGNKPSKIVLVEADPQLGGLCGSWDLGEYTIEKFYHQWYANDPLVKAFLDRVGLGAKMQTYPISTQRYFNNTDKRIGRAKDVAGVGSLSLIEKARMALAILRLSLVRDWRKIDAISLEDFLVPISGKSAYQKLWAPVLANKFGERGKEVSSVWLWQTLKNGRAARGGDRGTKMMSYFEGGFAALIDQVNSFLKAHDVDVLTDSPVERIERLDDGRFTARIGDEVQEFDQVLLTCAPDIINRICAPSALKSPLADVPYAGNICLVLRLSRSLSNSYWTSVVDPEFPFVGLIEHSNFVPPEDYEGDKLVYLSRYIDVQHPHYSQSDESYFDFCVTAIQRMFPDFDTSWVKGYSVWRTPYGQPVNVANFHKLTPPERVDDSGLYICNMAQIYPKFRGTAEALNNGHLVAERMLADLAASTLNA